MATRGRRRDLTDYLVLRKPPPLPANTAGAAAPGWTEVGNIDASTADAAIKACAEKHGKGEYVAVPARSWKPRTVTVVKQVTEVRFK